MAYAAQFVTVDEDNPCELEEMSMGKCPMCVYQNDNIIQSMSKVEQSLQGKIESKQTYTILCDMYHKHIAPLRRQGKELLDLDEEICKEHYTKHVVNTTQQVADDILYCSKMQRHYQRNIALRSSNSGTVVLNPQNVQEYVKISRHKLELVKYFTTMQKKKQNATQDKATPYKKKRKNVLYTPP